MVDYKVTVYTQDVALAGTVDNIYVTLVGTSGESEHTKLKKLLHKFSRGDVSSFTVTCSDDIGDLQMIKIQKKPFLHINSCWLPAKVEVESPIGKMYTFPIYHWFTDSNMNIFREGAALLGSQDNNSYLREKEKKKQQDTYIWDNYKKGIPHCVKADTLKSLPPDDCFSSQRTAEFMCTAVAGIIELELEEFAECKKKWTSIEDIEHLYRCHITNMSDYAMKHWREDAFFGEQFLNGLNPMLIRLCKNLPANFSVSKDMVFQGGQCSLSSEMENNNIFLCDYKILDGVQPNTIQGVKQYLTAPLVLLHRNGDKMMPIAIQLKQKPGKDNPVFLPTDKDDWLLAKVFVKSADFNLHELNFHLLRSHLLAEVFTVSTKRNFPSVHPLFKLLMPHTRYTLQINVLARKLLISKEGVFTKFTASGGSGVWTILKRSFADMTYRSLCIPDDIADRGLEHVPNFFYRDDGLQLWNIIKRFVQEVLQHYYHKDEDVRSDGELQAWIKDIFKHGFLSEKKNGIPQQFDTLKELVKFVTMVIFTCSAQHAAVNSGQYDFCGWMPNAPCTMQTPPPTKKGTVTEATILNALPDIKTTIHTLATIWLLSKTGFDARYLGNYVEEHFTEEFPRQKIRAFQDELSQLSKKIENRNQSLDVPYKYLDPSQVENSVSL
ncbi:Arachidonate 15-lipoxygenase B [Oryzias melastigma]|uniref:Arachidonate 15-lipoxygenase B n=1 Tax=Oryzias melastigma TaxID=30732 RepID=A0A834CFH4_ORYME|nr:Arachidonate 15-lipoxygenase B [Oryzias melastigma]